MNKKEVEEKLRKQVSENYVKLNTEPITKFRDEFQFLSNFYIDDTFNNKSVEHRYQASKTLNLKQRKKILKAKTPNKAKGLGRLCDLRTDWEKPWINDYPKKLVLWLVL